jgi:hypothetical protein
MQCISGHLVTKKKLPGAGLSMEDWCSVNLTRTVFLKVGQIDATLGASNDPAAS